MDINFRYISNSKLFLIIILALLSVFIVFSQNDHINRDGVLYLTQAKYILDGNYENVQKVFNWAFFSFLIAKTHNLLGISLQNSAHLINVLFFLISCFYFFKIISILSDNKIPNIYSFIVIICSVPIIDDYLAMILRDHGQWAGIMMGIYGYLKWNKSNKYSDIFLWQLGFFIAFLFRIETIVFNFLTLLFHQLIFVEPINLKKLYVKYIILFSLFCFLLTVANTFENLNYYLRERTFDGLLKVKFFFNDFFQPLEIYSNNKLLKILLDDFGISFKLIFFIYIFFYKLIFSFGILQSILIFIAIKNKLIKRDYLKILLFFIFILCILIIGNLFSSYVLSSRYFVPVWLIFNIFVVFGLYHVWQLKFKFNKILRIFILLFIFISLLIVLIDSPKKDYDFQASRWIKDNQIDLNTLYFDDRRIAYYSGLLPYDIYDIDVALANNQITNFVVHKEYFKKLYNSPDLSSIKHFPSESNAKLIIFKRITND